MSRVLVTGARGFVGRHAVTALAARGHEVVATTSGALPDTAAPGVRWVRADLLAPGGAEASVAAAGATHLLHFAWYAEHGRFWTAPVNLDWVGATLRLVRAFEAAGGRRAVVAGSCAEYSWSPGGTCVEGETPLDPATVYGAAKHGTRVAADAFAREAGLSLAWGRIFFCFGPGEAPGRLVPAVATALLRGEEARVTEGRQIRDFIASEELGDAFAAVLDSGVEGAVNVASGRAVAVRDVVAAVGRATGREDLIRYGALPTRPNEPERLVAAVERLSGEVGWTPRESLEAGIERCVAHWRARVAPGGAAGADAGNHG